MYVTESLCESNEHGETAGFDVGAYARKISPDGFINKLHSQLCVKT